MCGLQNVQLLVESTPLKEMSFLVNCGFSRFIKAKAGPVNNAALIAETSCDKRYWLISAFHSPCDEHRWPTCWLFPCGSVLLCRAGKLCIEWPGWNGLPPRSAVRCSVPETHDVTLGVTLWRALCVWNRLVVAWRMYGFFQPHLLKCEFILQFIHHAAIQSFYLMNTMPY